MGPDTARIEIRGLNNSLISTRKPVLYMCYLYLCDKTLAEDAVQETFLKVYKGWTHSEVKAARKHGL